MRGELARPVRRRAEETHRPKGRHRASVRPNHSAAALWIARGAHPKAIMERLGHSSIQMTLDRYGHLFPSLDATLTDGLEATFRSSLLARDAPMTSTVASIR